MHKQHVVVLNFLIVFLGEVRGGEVSKVENCIVLHNINKYFGKHKVLNNVNIEVPYGAIYGMLGPSGCGKSTTVKIVAGILDATSGEAVVLNERMPDLQLMNDIGYMAQSDALYEDLTARENMEFFGSLYGMSKGQILNRTLEVSNIVNLENSLDKKVSEFSGGMKRRLSLALSVLHSPKLLILDEPTVGIDPLLRKSIWGELYKMSDRGITILVTTHVMDEAEKCSHLVMMREGSLIASGTPGEIQQKADAKNLEDAFLFFAGGDEWL